MKLTVAVVVFTALVAALAARHARPHASPQSAMATGDFETFAQQIHVEVNETSTTITVPTPNVRGAALAW